MTGSRTASGLVVVAAMLLAATVVSAYAWRAFFEPDQFADRAAAALQDERVRDAIAERVTDDLVLSRNPDLLAGRPIIASVVGRLVDGDVFAGLLRRSVRDVHAAVLHSDQDTASLAIADIGIVVGAALEAIDPRLAAELRSQRVVVLSRRLGSATADAARAAERLRWIAFALAALTLAVAATALVASSDRQDTVRRPGTGSPTTVSPRRRRSRSPPPANSRTKEPCRRRARRTGAPPTLPSSCSTTGSTPTRRPDRATPSSSTPTSRCCAARRPAGACAGSSRTSSRSTSTSAATSSPSSTRSTRRHREVVAALATTVTRRRVRADDLAGRSAQGTRRRS